MRILLFLLLLSPSLIYAGCVDCDEVHAEIERETEIDSNYHDCRNCKAVTPDMEDITTNCPPFGSVCENKFYANTLSDTGNCQCLKARCAPNAKLWVTMDVGGVPTSVQKSRMSCNNSRWMVDGEVFESATCAKNCDTGACKNSNPKVSASGDYTPLPVIAASLTSKCATSDACPNGAAVFNSDGSYAGSDPRPIPPEAFTCTGEGQWMFSSSQIFQYVMCLASNCGIHSCPPFIWTPVDPAALDLVPLTVTSHGADCATATCKYGFVEIGEVGLPVGEPNTDSPQIKCKVDGTWEGYPTGVMCKQPPCPEDCDPSTDIPNANGQIFPLTKPIRKGCDYLCPDNQGLFYYDTHVKAPVTISHVAKSDHIGSTCVSGKYIVNSTLSVDRVGCYSCPFSDGFFAGSASDPRVKVDHCVLSCPDKYKLQYTNADSMRLDVNSLYVTFPDSASVFATYFYDAQRGLTYISSGQESIKEFNCVPQ